MKTETEPTVVCAWCCNPFPAQGALYVDGRHFCRISHVEDFYDELLKKKKHPKPVFDLWEKGGV